MTVHLCCRAFNEPVFLPLWLDYHSRAAPEAKLHVLYQGTSPDVLVGFHPPAKKNAPVRLLTTNEVDPVLVGLRRRWPDVDFRFRLPLVPGDEEEMTQLVEGCCDDILWMGATAFGYLDCDEFLIPTEGTLGEWLDSFENDPEKTVGCATGYQVYHRPEKEARAFERSEDALLDRSLCYKSVAYSKPCIVKQPATWTHGFHRRCIDPLDRKGSKVGDIPTECNVNGIPSQLDLVHMATFDTDTWVKRQASRATTLRGTAFEPIRNTQLPDQDMVERGPQPVKDSWRGKILRLRDPSKIS